jgi:hypothetical protein
MDVTAVPQTIEPFLHRVLDNPKQNARKYLALKREVQGKTPIVEAFPEAFLYQVGQRCFVLDDNKKRVAYFMQWEVRRVFGVKAAYQIMVWSDPTSPVRGLALDVFYDFLLSDTEVVVTDCMQSPSDRRFWYVVITEAFRRGYAIYHLNLLNKEKRRLGSIDAVTDDMWNPHQVGQASLLCVTAQPIWGSNNKKGQ